MLAAGQRLRRRDEFTSAIRAGRRAGRGGVVVHVATPVPVTSGTAGAKSATMADQPAPFAVSARAGFVVPKAVGSAVTRNKIRRRLRHLVRERLAALPAGTDLVIRVLPEATQRSYGQLGTDLDAAIAAAQNGRSGRAGGRRRADG